MCEVNYIAELNAFDKLRRVEIFTTAEIVVWYALIQGNNESGWKEWFNVPVSVMENRTGLTRNTIYTARKKLQERGLIEVANGKKGSSSEYKMTRLASINSDIDTKIMSTTDNELPLNDDEHKNNVNPQSTVDNNLGLIEGVYQDQHKDQHKNNVKISADFKHIPKQEYKQNKTSVSNLSVDLERVDKGGSRGEKGAQEVEPIAREPAQHSPENKQAEPKKTKRFVKPSVDEVRDYCLSRSNGIDAQTFVDFYESKGWLVGKSPMKDWKAAVRTWEKRDNRSAGYNARASPHQGKKPTLVSDMVYSDQGYFDLETGEYVIPNQGG